MKIVHGDEQPLLESQTVRAGKLGRRYLFDGEDDASPGNFIFMLAYQSGDFYAPRHHHNFDQWRYQIEGEVGFGPSGVMKPGTLGYFPEGAFYGPNSHGEADVAPDAPNCVAVMQFGGPAGNGFIKPSTLYATHEKLKAFGRFEKGVFYRRDDLPGKKTMDSFQASWEFATGRRMVYPKPQYRQSIMMDTQHYRWMPLEGAPGVEHKHYGTFTDCAIRGASYKLDPGATLAAAGRGVFFVLSGAGAIEGAPYRRFTALLLETGENALLHASETTEVLLLGLPEIARMRTPMPEALDVDLDLEVSP
jgi:hypothetical protein